MLLQLRKSSIHVEHMGKTSPSHPVQRTRMHQIQDVSSEPNGFGWLRTYDLSFVPRNKTPTEFRVGVRTNWKSIVFLYD